MPEALVRAPGSDDMEVDLWAIADGQIIIGEAKKNDRLESTAARERARCTALRALAQAMTADKFVMATSSPQWCDRTRQNVTALIHPTTPVHWLEGLGP